MYKFMLLTFGVLGWSFYEFSGGADFEPETIAFAEAAEEELVEETAPIVITQSVITPDPVVETDSSIEAVITKAALSIEPEALEVISEPETTETVLQLTAAVQENIENTLTFEPVELTASTDIIDLREVAGSRVNMRSGPGTNYGVITTLTQGTETEVLEIDPSGWARLRVVGSGQVGWMAERLLSQP